MVTEIKTNDGPVLLFLTRSFTTGLAALSQDVENVTNSYIQKFFDSVILNCVSKKYEFQNIFFENGTFNWTKFIKYSEEIKFPLNGFNGTIKQLITNGGPKNIFMFYHWFDKQINLNDTSKLACIRDYLMAIVRDIRKIIAQNEESYKIRDFRLVLHEGDYLGIDPVKVQDIIWKNTRPLVDSIKFYSYHHESGNLIFDRILNNRELESELNEELKIKTNSIEEFLLSRFDLSLIDEEFEKKLIKQV